MEEIQPQACGTESTNSCLFKFTDVNDLDDVGDLILKEPQFAQVRDKLRSTVNDDLWEDSHFNDLILGKVGASQYDDSVRSDDGEVLQMVEQTVQTGNDGWRAQHFLFIYVLGQKKSLEVENDEKKSRLGQIKHFQDKFNKPDAVTIREAHTTDDIIKHLGDYLENHLEETSLRVIFLAHGKKVGDEGLLSTKDRAANGASQQNGPTFSVPNSEIHRRLAECIATKRPASAGKTLPIHFYYCYAKRGAPKEETHKDQFSTLFDKREKPAMFVNQNDPSDSESFPLKRMANKLEKADQLNKRARQQQVAEQEGLSRALPSKTGGAATEASDGPSASGVEPQVSIGPSGQLRQEDNCASVHPSDSSVLPNSPASPKAHPPTQQDDSPVPNSSLDTPDGNHNHVSSQHNESGMGDGQVGPGDGAVVVSAPPPQATEPDVEESSELSDAQPQRKKLSKWKKLKQRFTCGLSRT